MFNGHKVFIRFKIFNDLTDHKVSKGHKVVIGLKVFNGLNVFDSLKVQSLLWSQGLKLFSTVFRLQMNMERNMDVNMNMTEEDIKHRRAFSFRI